MAIYWERDDRRNNVNIECTCQPRRTVRYPPMTISIQTAVDRLIDARSTRRLLPPLSETDGDLSLEHAYAIQDELRAELDRRGERPIGWKLGATSPAGQAVMGLQEPACGFLLPARYASGAEVSISKSVNLGVEAGV